MCEHRPIDFCQDVVSYLNYEIGWPNSENANIESRVVDLAERKSVGNPWLASRVGWRVA